MDLILKQLHLTIGISVILKLAHLTNSTHNCILLLRLITIFIRLIVCNFYCRHISTIVSIHFKLHVIVEKKFHETSPFIVGKFSENESLC